MKKHINTNSRLLKVGLAVMAVVTLTSVVSAQDSFDVKITYPKGVSVEANYTAMEQQAQKYCMREARRVSDRGIPRKFRTEYIRKCVDQVMGNVLSKIQDDSLLAYHKAQNAERTSVAANSYNSTN